MISIGFVSLMSSCLALGDAVDEDLSFPKKLAQRFFPSAQDAPNFVSLPNSPYIAVADNDTAILKIWDLKISHYPLKQGRITFWLDNFLTHDIPKDSNMELVSFVKDELLFNGTLPVCDYLVFANMHCPVKADSKKKTTKHVLQVPEQAGDGSLSFKAKVTNPEGELIIHVAGEIDLKNDGSVAEELEQPNTHDEL